ncbi:ATP-binding protein [Azospirillum sp. BE72]|uniref:sensor histidine kinase n=1 Tax=Azospirillum sp. BE72 TaxID=2817776 RepID=UPI00286485DF|nr:ATP-binding protein [Azospirillum sp. BE72]MDR6775062.1 PAS domain S-box-containing protein [Azospirillum sp. BE72]
MSLSPVAGMRIGLLAAVIAGFWLVAYADLERTRDRALQDGLRQTSNLSSLLEEDARRAMVVAGYSLHAITEGGQIPAHLLAETAWAPGAGAGPGQALRTLLIVERDGRVRQAAGMDTLASVAGTPLAEAAAGGSAAFVGPYREAGGGWRAAMVRPLADGSGSAVAVLDLDRFTRLYATQNVGPLSIILFYRENGAVLAYSRAGLPLDRDRAAFAGFLPRLPADETARTLSGFDPAEGRERIGTVRRVAGLPFYVYVRIRTDDVLAGWYADRWKRVLETAAVSVVVMLLALLALRQLGRLETTTQALRASERRSQALFDSSFQIMGLLSPDGRVLALNRPACALAGLPAEALIGRRAWEFRGWARTGELAEAFRQSIGKAASGRLVRYETDVIADGVTRVMDVTIKPVFDDGGAVTVLVVEARDITERVEAAERLAAALDQAEAANRAKSAFLATMSHELRTPLNAIIGFSDIMLHELFGPLGSPRYHDYARHVQNSGRHLLDLINDVLDMSKLEAGRYTLDESWLEPADAIETCRALAAVPADAGGVTLESDCAPGLPRLLADERALRQVLLNLLSNAVKFTPRGGRVTVTAGLEAGDGLAIAVCDTGIGIPADALARILEPFQQADSSIPGRFGGTGLGLSICRDLMALHGGSLSIDSEPGCGTVVTVRFPAGRVAQPVAADGMQA